MTQRTLSQNAALHLWCERVAAELNDSGMSVQEVLAQAVERPWTKESVKELLWRPIQTAMTGKDSSADVNKLDYPAIYDVLNRHFAEKLNGLHVSWPSEDQQ